MKKRILTMLTVACMALSFSMTAYAAKSPSGNPGGGGGTTTPIEDPKVPQESLPVVIIDEEEVPLTSPKTGESNLVLFMTAAGAFFAGAAVVAGKKVTE